jgi:hypothetical protein
MTKLEELEAAMLAAAAAANAASWGAIVWYGWDAAADTVWDAVDAARDAYKHELERTHRKSQ